MREVLPLLFGKTGICREVPHAARGPPRSDENSPPREGREPKAPGWVVDEEETHPGGFAATPPQGIPKGAMRATSYRRVISLDRAKGGAAKTSSSQHAAWGQIIRMRGGINSWLPAYCEKSSVGELERTSKSDCKHFAYELPELARNSTTDKRLSTHEIARALFEDLLPRELGGDYGRLRTTLDEPIDEKRPQSVLGLSPERHGWSVVIMTSCDRSLEPDLTPGFYTPVG